MDAHLEVSVPAGTSLPLSGVKWKQVDKIITAMKDHKADGEAQSNCCVALQHLALNPLNKTYIREKGGIALILSALSDHPQNLSLVYNAYEAFAKLCLHSLENCTLLIENGGVDLIIDGLSSVLGKQDEAIREDATLYQIYHYLNVAENPSPSEGETMKVGGGEGSRSNSRTGGHGHNKGALHADGDSDNDRSVSPSGRSSTRPDSDSEDEERLAEVAAQFAKTAGKIQVGALHALAAVASSSASFKDYIVDRGAWVLVRRALQHHVEDDSVELQEAATLALAALSGDSSGRRTATVLDSEAWELVVAAFKHQLDSQDPYPLLVAACIRCAGIIGGDPTKLADVRKKGCLPLILKSMKTFDDEECVQREGCRALASLARDPYAQLYLKERGALKLAVTAKAEFSALTELADAAIRALQVYFPMSASE